MSNDGRSYNREYEGEYLNRVAFPIGGIGAGMICLEGTGALSHASLRNRMEFFHEPCWFAAVGVKGGAARVLEGPVPTWKAFGPAGTGNGAMGKAYGLPRFRRASFLARFPFATVTLAETKVPLEVTITGWSPFVPGDADASSLPVAGLEYAFTNPGGDAVEAVFSFHSRNFLARGSGRESVRPAPGGFILDEPGSPERPHDQAALCAATDAGDVAVNCVWPRGGWFDALTLAWQAVEQGRCISNPQVAENPPSPGGSLYVPVTLAPGQTKTIRLMLCWTAPRTNIRMGKDPGADDGAGACCCDGCDTPDAETYAPWYAGHFASVDEVSAYWRDHYDALRQRTKRFSDCFYDTTLPPEVVEAAAANVTILKSPTVLRQTDGRLWCWEGCCDDSGCCHGSCTHVWNYAQALPHLFPGLERTLRETEFLVSQDDRGHQTFRASLPIRPPDHGFHAAADGQLGGIMKVYREWRISGDTDWLRRLWPRVKASLNYCIETWDPDHKGVLEEPHHNTYDIEFWGPDGMCGSFYLGALTAAVAMGREVDDDVSLYESLRTRGRDVLENELFNGEYFEQKVVWKGLRAGSPAEANPQAYPPENLELLRTEGPKYQYGSGCLADGVLGAWLAAVCGLPEPLAGEKVRSHLLAVHRHNLRADLSEHANPQRPAFAMGSDGGLLLCTWPRGNKPSLPFPYSDEVWTGIEYHVASHLMMFGHVAEALQIVRTCRDRYDGRVRNPFDEYECGHWYARAMSSYGLLQGLTGVRYDAVARTLIVRPAIGGDFRSFLCTAGGYGTAGVKDGEPFLDVVEGTIEIDRIEYTARAGGAQGA